MRITETFRFRRSYEHLSKPIRIKSQKQFRLFVQNLFHPSLHTEKLKPKENNVWSFRIDRKFRVIFTFSAPDTILLLDIGPHDIYRKRP